MKQKENYCQRNDKYMLQLSHFEVAGQTDTLVDLK
jgi:hypothetical protein